MKTTRILVTSLLLDFLVWAMFLALMISALTPVEVKSAGCRNEFSQRVECPK